MGRFLSDIARLERFAFSLSTGFRAAVFAITPLVIGFATGHLESVLVTFGALFVINTEGPPATAIPLRFLILGCFTEAAAFALGTLASTAGPLAILLVGVGVFIALVAGLDPALTQVGTFTAVAYAVGMGLPGGSAAAAGDRLWLFLLGGLWAFLGAWLHWSSKSNSGSRRANQVSAPFSEQLNSYFKVITLGGRPYHSAAFRHAIAVGVASAFGLAIGLALGLPRDFWIVVTIITGVRPKIGPTIRSASMVVMGTIAGAAIAAGITLEISDLYLLGGILFAFAVFMFATRGVNPVLSQVFFTPFIIILLDILYQGRLQLAEVRILDVTIGGAIAIATVYLLGIRSRAPS
jgi:uncharacterized membrane protein YgaE (UPF0421/DUF939 family)